MNITDIFMNPIVIGLLAGLITYIYMKWRLNSEKNNKKNKNKKVNLLIPFAVFVVAWFIAYAYVSNCEDENEKSENITPPTIFTKSSKMLPQIKTNMKPRLSSSEGDTPLSFELMSKSNGIYIPDKLPEVFFDIK